jgi:exopolysaccharide production protein ExoZ
MGPTTTRLHTTCPRSLRLNLHDPLNEFKRLIKRTVREATAPLPAFRVRVFQWALRAFAAASVVVHHILVVAVQKAGYQYKFPSTAAAGVDFFFLISGFIMVYTHFDDFGEVGSPAAFIWRRVIRVVPLYWIATTATIVLLLVIPGAFSTQTLKWDNVVPSYLLLLSREPDGSLNTILPTGWTLCYEMYFYALFALLLFLSRCLFLIIAGLVFAAGLAMHAAKFDVPVWATVATNPLLLEFYLGTLIAFLFIQGYSLRPLLAVVGAAASIATAFLLGDPVPSDWIMRVLYWGLPAAVILSAAISLERAGLRVPRLLTSLGESSYSLYLFHIFLVVAFAKIWSYADLAETLPVYVLGLLSFVGALGISHMIYLHIEKPLTGWLRSFKIIKMPSHRALRSR